jgi:C-terminal processing protease CtpA/Prc
MPGFSYGDTETYKHFIDSFFNKCAEASYLVIDVRKNRGGNGYWGFYLLDNLTNSDYQIAKLFEFKVSDMMRNSIYAGKAGYNLFKAKNGEYIEAINHRIRGPHKTPNKFKGKVFLLISEKTFSAGAVFAAVFKANEFGLTIGQETAGRISLGSDPVTVKLSNSKLKASIPTAIYTLPGGDPDRGVIPDIMVSRTIDDYRLGKDVEMEITKNLIEKDIMNRNSAE